MRLLTLLLCLTILPVFAADKTDLPNTAGSFSTAKKWLYDKVYKDHAVTFYCGCKYNPKNRRVDLKSCGLEALANVKRAQRIEAEHVMPAHHFGQSRQCWRKPDKVCPGKDYSGRRCCEHADPLFEAAHNDLHNLFPAVGEVNGDRSNYPWGMIPGEKREYGTCNIEVNSSIRRAEPPDTVKGDIARVYFYMERTYGFNISRQQRQLFTAWAKTDPPDEWEYERNNRIAEIQGRGNPFITAAVLSGETVTEQPAKPATPAPEPAKTDSKFSCTPRKTCGKMDSCEEAYYHLEECGNGRLDRDKDGIPCESICN
jgi:deoxyribonuclease-1